MLPQHVERIVAVEDRQRADDQVTKPARNRNRRHEGERSNLCDACEQDEQLEWSRWRQHGGHHQRQHATPAVQRQRALDMTPLQALREECLTAAFSDEIQHIAPRNGAGCCHQRVVRHQRLVAHHHQDDEQIVDLWQRDERGVEEGDNEEAWTAE